MTVTIRAAAGHVEAATLQALLKQLASQFQYMILASREDRIFQSFDLAQTSRLEAWPEGVVFGATGELRWRPKQGKFAVCFLVEDAALPPPVLALPEQETLVTHREELKIRLWGEHTSQDVVDDQPVWFEAQIPRLLAYPLAQPPTHKNVAMKVYRYRRADQTVAFVRFVDLASAGEALEAVGED